MIKIMHVLSTNSFSGAENVACQIIKLCQTPNCSFIYCSPKGDIDGILKSKQITYHPIEKLTFHCLKKAINDFHPDVIHAHDRKASLLSVLCAGKIPVISHIHGKFDDMKRISKKNIMFTLSAIRASRIICVSNSVYNEWIFAKLFKNKIDVKRNIVQLDSKVYSYSTIKYDICFVGRLVYEKNIPRLISILKLIVDARNITKIVICGDGIERDLMNNLIADMHLENNIEYKGFVENPVYYISQSKLMIMTSRTEGTPMVALEALSIGKPIISTPTDGMNELIENGVNGYLSNDDNEISSLIIDLIENPRDYFDLCQTTKEHNSKIIDIEGYKKYFWDLYDGYKTYD